MTEADIQYLLQTNLELQESLDRIREQRNEYKEKYEQVVNRNTELLQVIKEKNSTVDRLKVLMQQGVEL